jgi:opacity protein-like surface antigen
MFLTKLKIYFNVQVKLINIRKLNYMKKILLATAAMAVLSTSSAMAATGDFYGKANVGWSKLDNVKTSAKVKFKSQNAAFVALGAGYYVMDNVRADVTLDHFFNVEHKFSNRFGTGKLKTNINTLMLNGYVDLFDAGVAKFFAGAGVGSSFVSSKYSHNITDYNAKAKNKAYMTYALHLGASAELTEGVRAELTYSYRDLNVGSKVKFKDIDGDSFEEKIKLKGHHVAAGVRFDF